MYKIYLILLLLFFVLPIITMENQGCDNNKKLVKKYTTLKDKLGYDPKVKVFHHLRRLIFDHSQSEFGKEFFPEGDISGYIHGFGENGNYAYEFCIDDMVEHVYTFDFPPVDSPKNYVTERLKFKRIVQKIACYIKDAYAFTKIELFAARPEAIALLNYLDREKSEDISIKLFLSFQCMKSQMDAEVDAQKALMHKTKRRENKWLDKKKLKELDNKIESNQFWKNVSVMFQRPR